VLEAEKIIKELKAHLTPMGEFRARAMFGGYGLYIDGVIFGILAYNKLFLKTDDNNRPDFEKAKSQPFAYQKSTGKMISLSYWECPALVKKDPIKLRQWITRSLAASRNSKKTKAKRERLAKVIW